MIGFIAAEEIKTGEIIFIFSLFKNAYIKNVKIYTQLSLTVLRKTNIKFNY